MFKIKPITIMAIGYNDKQIINTITDTIAAIKRKFFKINKSILI